MSNSHAVQAARKKMHLARLEQKGKQGYSEFYRNQPFQIEKARKNKQWQDATKALKDANEALEIAEITGEGLEVAKEAQAIAALVVERSKPPRRGEPTSTILTATGA